jgi:hypothetical protein
VHMSLDNSSRPLYLQLSHHPFAFRRPAHPQSVMAVRAGSSHDVAGGATDAAVSSSSCCPWHRAPVPCDLMVTDSSDATGDGFGNAAPLMVHVQRKVKFAERNQGPLPPWNEVMFGELGQGPNALPWDGRFRPLPEFESRWEQILSATTRSWVNLNLAGVRDGRLFFFVEYLTDEHMSRTWPNEAISINGGAGKFERDLLSSMLRGEPAELPPADRP